MVIQLTGQINVFDEKDVIKNGCYWKLSNNEIYWSNNDKDIQKDVHFKTIPQFYNHRKANGYPLIYIII